MVLLVYEDQLKDHFSTFGDTADLDARWVHDLRQMYHRLRNNFGCTEWNSYVMWVM
jgi:hypothetical protein